MNHEIDLKNINTRTDLAIEILPESRNERVINDNISVTTINIDSKNENYVTIKFKDITDHDNFDDVKKVLIDELNNVLKKMDISANASALIVGLGNEKSTPDSLGPKVIDDILVTRHLFNLNLNVEKGFRCVSAISPGVTGQTGIETMNIISSLIDEVKPSFLIVIDALKASKIENLNKIIQISDSGISPGSGIGNKRKKLSFDTLHIPVISIGIPTVVDAVTIVYDAIEYVTKDYTYEKDYNNLKQKLIINRNLTKLDIKPNKMYKKELFGLVGDLADEELVRLIDEVLSHAGYNLIVSEIEMDFIIKRVSKLISESLNNVLHENL